MSRPIVLAFALFVAWCAAPQLCADEPTVASGPARAKSITESATESTIEAALNKPVTLDVQEVSLQDTLQKLGKQASINIVLDKKGLEDASIDPNTPVTLTAKDSLLRDVLGPLLNDFDLVYAVQDDVLRITSKDRESAIFTTRLYPVDDLIGEMVDDDKRKAPNFNSLLSAIRIAQSDDYSNLSAVQGPAGWAIASSGNRRSHDCLAALLASLRETRLETRENPNAKLIAALEAETTFELKSQSIIEAIDWLAKKHKVPMVVDYRALADAAIDSTVKVELTVRRPVSLAAALDILLEPLELRHVIQYGAIRITSDERADDMIEVRAYLVEDLLDTRPGVRSRTDYLFDLLFDCVDPSEWASNSGPPPIMVLKLPWGQVMVVPGSDATHEDLTTLFAELRALNPRRAANARADAEKPTGVADNGGKHTAVPVLPAVISARQTAKRSREAALEATLAKSTSFTIEEQPLAAALEKISKLRDVDIRMDERFLADAQIDPSLLYAYHSHSPLPLADALEMILDGSGLACAIRHESLYVTSKESAEGTRSIRVYPVGDLVNANAPEVKTSGRKAIDPLLSLIMATIEPSTWAARSKGGYGSISLAYPPGGPALVANCKRSVHANIVALLAGIRAGVTTRESDVAAKIETSLEQPVTLNIDDKTLGDAIGELVEKYKLPIWPDSGRYTDERVSLRIEQPIALGAAFDLLLEPVEMTTVIRHGRLWIKNKEQARRIVETRVYMVNDLVERGEDGQERCKWLAVAIEGLIEPRTWRSSDEDVSFNGIGVFEGPKGWMIAVTTTKRLQRQITTLLAEIRAAKR